VHTPKLYLLAISTTPNGNPKPKKIGYWKLVSSSMPNVEIFAEFNGETIFEIRPKVAGKSLENLPHGQLQAR